jgi:hypothetical protein
MKTSDLQRIGCKEVPIKCEKACHYDAAGQTARSGAPNPKERETLEDPELNEITTFKNFSTAELFCGTKYWSWKERKR